MKAFCISVIALLFSVGTSFAQTFEEANEKYQQGGAKFQGKEFSQAVSLFKEALKLGVEAGTEESLELVKEVKKVMPQAQLFVGIMAAKENKLDEAIVAFLEAEEMADLYGNSNVRRQAARYISNVYQSKGITAFNGKNFADALESFSKGYGQDPSNIQLSSFLAKTYAELKQYDKAGPLFQTIIDAGASNSKYEDNAAEANKDVENYFLSAISEAAQAKDFDKVVELSEYVSSNPSAALMMMQTANNLKKFDVLLSKGQSAADLQSDLSKASEIYFLMGTAYAARENKAKAIELLSKVTSGSNVSAAKALIVELRK